MCLKSIVLSRLFESVRLWPWGWIAWQVSAVILACLLWTGQLRRWCRAPVSPLPVRPGGGRGMGAAGQLGESPFSCRAASPEPAPPAPSLLPSMLVLLTDSYLPAAGHAHHQPTADKMLM